MFKKDNFFKNYLVHSEQYKKNIKKTQGAFNLLKSNIQDSEIPMLKSYEKDYIFDFSPNIVKKFIKFSNVVIIGMGGSILGSRAIYDFFREKIKKNIFFFDNLDNNLYSEFKKIKNLKNTCYIIISKSGNTLETLTNLNLILARAQLKNKLIIISEIKNSSLMNMANKFNAEVIEHKDFIGGRYSVMSEAGMFPARLMNLNINNFKNLRKLINDKTFVSSLIKNVSSIYTLNQEGIKNSVILNYDSRLDGLGSWYQQLVGESLGKKGKGITPIVSGCPRDHHSLLQLYLDGPKDKFFTFFYPLEKKGRKIDFIVKAQCEAARNIFIKKNIPSRHFIFKKNDENELGAIFTFFVLETIILSRLMGVNPFTQPAVEEVKIETKKFLRRN